MTGLLPSGRLGAVPFRLHDDIEPHVHLSDQERAAIERAIWQFDNVELTTVGIDIGSSTSHLMFSRIHLQREANALSSRFMVVGRRTLWRSPIRLTPFLDDDTIDTRSLEEFIDGAHAQAGLRREQIDTGAVILTGEAIKRKNASAIAALFAADAGKFVCASAGHRLECVLAAHGSGAVALSRAKQCVVLNVDIGGGTTKLALCKDGDVVSTCAFAIGGRLVAVDGADRLARLDQPGRVVAEAVGAELVLGEAVPPVALARMVDVFADIILGYIRRDPPAGLAQALLLTEPLEGPPADLVTFSGGVAEFIYGREQGSYGDIGGNLAQRVRQGVESLGLPVKDAGQGIRATSIGASQFTVQVSGKTAHLGTVRLPLHNVPAIVPQASLIGRIDPTEVAEAIAAARGRLDASDINDAIAVGLRFPGSPEYVRLRALAEGIAMAFADAGDGPLVLMLDRDVGRALGRMLDGEFGLRRRVICLDGVELKDFEYVDVGAPIEPTHVVPVVVKSLLFGAG